MQSQFSLQPVQSHSAASRAVPVQVIRVYIVRSQISQ